MELWIRSQDRTILTKIIEDIYVFGNSNKTFTIKNDKWQLGNYKTKERALEVLDEIHQRLIDLQSLEIANDFYKVCKRNLDNVYEMPKE